jgi:serine/threonine protein phosphatase PrpC
MAWRTAHASVRGTSHIAEMTLCQDFHLLDEAGEYLIIAVADGAGSARLAHLGAQVACTWAVHHLKSRCSELLDLDSADAIMRHAFDAALREVQEAAAREAALPRDLASTLLVALVGDGLAVFGQVGDGAAVYDTGTGLLLAHWPEQEMANLTDFLTSAPLVETLTVTRAQGRVSRIALMTDGLTNLLLDFRARSPHVPVFERLLGACRNSPDPAGLNEDLSRFLDSVPVNERSDDDKTLVLAVRETWS